jgi:hypothetical protein
MVVSMIDNLDLARHLASLGLCVMPLVSGGKIPARPWKRLQSERPTDAELVLWFGIHDYEPAIVTGAISGITVIDCDSPDAVRWWLGNGHASGLRQATRRGMHFVYRHAAERNTSRVLGIDGIDRRGQGGYVRAYADAAAWTSEALDRLTQLPATGGPPPRVPRPVIDHAAVSISHRDGSGFRMTWNGLAGSR